MKYPSMFYQLALVVGAFCIFWSGPALSNIASEVSASVPQARLVGEARMTYLFWDVYDAKLYARNSKWRSDEPFALELAYLRDLKGKAIAKRSIEEIRKQGFTDEPTLSLWYKQLTSILPDVNNGMRLTGVVNANSHTEFYLDGKQIAYVDDPLFSKWFFNIWLGEATSEPKLRQQLLGAE